MALVVYRLCVYSFRTFSNCGGCLGKETVDRVLCWNYVAQASYMAL